MKSLGQVQRVSQEIPGQARDEDNKPGMRTIGWWQGQQARDEDRRPAMSTTGPVMRDIKIIFRRNLQIFSRLLQKVHFPRFCSWQRPFYFVSLQKFHITFSSARPYENKFSIALLARDAQKLIAVWLNDLPTKKTLVIIHRIIFLSRLRREPTVDVRSESQIFQILTNQTNPYGKNIKIWQIWVDLWDFCPTGHSLIIFAE